MTWWPSPLPGCQAPRSAGGATVDDLMRALAPAPSKPCDAPTYLVPGLPLSMAAMPAADIGKLERSYAAMQGMGNKAIALAHCKRVKLDGFTIFKGGHFAVLASEVDGLNITGLDVDTNRDGLDLEAARRAFCLVVLNLNEFLYLD